MNTERSAQPIGRRSVAALIEKLNGAGFSAGTSEAIDATRLVTALAESEAGPMEAGRLCARLRPVFCKSREQQERFDTIFRAWYETPINAGEGAADRKPTSSETQPPPETKTIPWLAIGLILTIASIVAIVVRIRIQRIEVATATPPEVVAQPPGAYMASGGPTGPAQTQPAASVAGYFPRIRYNDELRPVWGWVLVSLPLVALAGFSIPALVIARTLGRRRRDPMYLDRQTLEEQARRIVPPLRAEVTGKLARHLRGHPDGEARLMRRPRLDVRATIEHTMRNRGIPAPRYRHTNAPPSYLLLIDVKNQREPRGRLFYQWAERLQRERLEVEIALVRRLDQAEPQFAPTASGELPSDDRGWMSLARLPVPPFGQRLLLVSDGDVLADEEGKWHSNAVAARLHRWRERAMFTPTEPRDWSVREEAIERSEHTADPGFLVLPLDENALSAWTDLLTTGRLSDITLSEPQRYPAILRRGDTRDLVAESDTAPAPERLEKLISQLRIYLGELGFTWLAALAVPPLVRWELTVLLGRDVVGRLTALSPKEIDAAIARHYRRLAKLPWLQRETMFDWLRLRLLAELSPTLHKDLKALVENLLGRLSPKPGSDGILLDFERPPGKEVTETVWASRKETDSLYLGYMSGLAPRQLAMLAPKSWANWVGNIRFPHERGWRGWFSRPRDHASAWWSRRVFLGGAPFAGLRSAPIGWALALLLVAAGALAVIASTDKRWWPESLQDRLFEEQAHLVAFAHTAPVRSASFSRDGLWVVTASDDGTARVWNVRTGAAVSPPLQHGPAVLVARISPDRKWVVTGASDGSVRLWETRGWTFTDGGSRHDGPVVDAEFTGNQWMPRGSEGMLTAGGTHVILWMLKRPLDAFIRVTTVKETIRRVSFSPSGRRYVITTDANSVVADTGAYFSAREGKSEFASISTDGRFVVLATRGSVEVWTTDARLKLATRSVPGVSYAEFSPNDNEVVLARNSGSASVWRFKTAELPIELPHGKAPLVTASFSSDGQRVLTAATDGVVRLWNANDGTPVGPPLRHDGAITSASFSSSDGLRIVTASLDGTARIWEAVSDPPETLPMRHRDDITAVSFDSTGRHVLTASGDSSAMVWDAITGAQLAPRLTHKEAIWSAELSPDGERVVTGSGDSTAVIWNWRTGTPTARLALGSQVSYAEFSPDGGRVVTTSVDGVARIWDARTGHPLGVPLEHEALVVQAHFSPDGREIVTSSFDGTARIWDGATGRPVGNPLRHAMVVRQARFSPDGQLIATASGDGTARVWDAHRGIPRTSSLKHEGPVWSVDFDPRSGRLVTGSNDGTARIWKASDGAPLRVLQLPSDVFEVAFSPDDLRIATVSDDGLRIWNAESGTLVAAPMRHYSKVAHMAFSRDGRFVVTGGSVQQSERVSLPLPNQYLAPRSSAQVWRVPPFSTPDTSAAQTARRRVVAEIAKLSRSDVIGLAAAATAIALIPLFLVTMRRQRRLQRLAARREEPR
jgi:WD40 repeat protein/uncharacterized protein with von Willebrand factor type A (vWA) domain